MTDRWYLEVDKDGTRLRDNRGRVLAIGEKAFDLWTMAMAHWWEWSRGWTVAVAAIIAVVLSGCDKPDTACYDSSQLLATTAGSPSYMTCRHVDHRMRVQVVTVPSNEEAAAVVFCECQRAAPAGSVTP